MSAGNALPGAGNPGHDQKAQAPGDLLETSSLAELGEDVELTAGESLFVVGDPAVDLYLLLSGSLIETGADNGRTELHPGQVPGAAAVVNQGRHASSTVAGDGPARLLRFGPRRRDRLEQLQPLAFTQLQVLLVRQLQLGTDMVIEGDRGLSGLLERPVRELMASPPVSLSADASIAEAHALLEERRIGGLLVTGDDGAPLGLATYHTLSRALLNSCRARCGTAGTNPAETPLSQALQSLYSISSDAPLWQAECMQRLHRAKYLMVSNADRAVGMISQTDILRHLTASANRFLAEVYQATGIGDLARLYRLMPKVASQAWRSHHHLHEAVRRISDVHLALQRRCVELTLAELQRQGHGQPPSRYALIIMGSGGRREMLLDPDQDNGLILPDNIGAEAIAWFQQFAERINENLDRVGYRLCPGDIMARNPQYHKSLDAWCRQLSHIAAHPTPKAARWANVTLDFRTLHGDHDLTAALQQHLLKSIGQSRYLFRLMVEDDAEGQPALGLFQRLKATGDHGGTVDLKRNGLRLIANAARIYCLSSGITATNTHDRLAALLRSGILESDLVDAAQAAYHSLLDLLMRYQLENHHAIGTEPPRKLPLKDLSSHDRNRLQTAMREVRRLQEALQARFGSANL
jgi:CBS domain-containing protein